MNSRSEFTQALDPELPSDSSKGKNRRMRGIGEANSSASEQIDLVRAHLGNSHDPPSFQDRHRLIVPARLLDPWWRERD
jgi:hypothetical protein